jgi:hypothetical protein
MIQAWWFWGLLVVVLVGLYLSQTAGRLDRLHIRVDRAGQALEVQLARRAAVAAELAASGLLDPATSLVVAEAAAQTRVADDGDARDEAEAVLTLALDAALPDPAAVAQVAARPGGDELVTELAAVTRRVELAESFLEDAIRSCLMVRERRLVRVLRLAGRAPWPVARPLDVHQPDGLAIASG